MLVPRCASHTVLSGNEIQRWAKHAVPGMECLRTRVRFPPPPPMPRATREGGPFLVRFVVFRTGAFSFTSAPARSEEHTSELQSLMRISYAVFCLKKNKQNTII